MNNPVKHNQNRKLVWGLFGLLGVALFAILAVFLSKYFPKPGCEPILVLGGSQYQIQVLSPNSDGTFEIPGNRPGNVYWIKGTDTNYVFGLSPTADNLSLETSLKEGEQALITLDNCNSTKFTLSVPQAGLPNNAALLDQSISGITVFVQPGSSPAGFVVKGELTEATITTFNTPDPAEIQAEISLLETKTSADGKTIRVGISILNSGQKPVTLTTGDVSLTPENAAAGAPEAAEPVLPKEIKAGASETIYFTFSRPATKTATFKVYSAEYELEGY